MSEELRFAGDAHTLSEGEGQAQIALNGAHDWVYVWLNDGKLVVLSDAACKRCRMVRDKVIRCQAHKSCKIIARQLRLI